METKYKVQRDYIYGWDDAFFSEEETPTLFDNKADAEQEIQGHIEEIKDAIKLGNMDKDSLEEREDFRIVEVDTIETNNKLIAEFMGGQKVLPDRDVYNMPTHNNMLRIR